MDNQVEMMDVIKESFEQYSGAVLQSRALVDARDCIKPSARQIYYAMFTDKYVHAKPYQKTLKSIASSMRFYIHGDNSVEGVLMHSAQPFFMRYPLVEVEGSYGTQMSTENWAAPRYTSSRLSPIADILIKDTNKHTIDEWVDNYDDTEQYPRVLSTLGYYNIVNGSMGIGVGISASIPQFNLREVNEAMIKLLQNPDIPVNEIICYPDYASGCELMNSEQVKESLRTGHGKAAIVRATLHYDKKDNCIVVTELPYAVYSNTICGEIEKMVANDPNCGIINVNDLTGLSVNIKIYLDKGINPDAIIKKLYAETSLQKSIGINIIMLDNGRYPKLYGWKEALQAHLDHEKHTYTAYYKYELEKAEARLDIVNGLLLAINNIDKTVNIIKSSNSVDEASKNLQTQIGLNEAQAKAVLEIKLSRLARLEAKKLEDEKAQLEAKIDEIKSILNSDEKLKDIMIKRFKEVAEKFGDARRTKLSNIDLKQEKKEITITPEKVIITLSKEGLIKRLSPKARKVDTSIISIIRTNTVDTLMVFTNLGQMYKISVNDLPEGAEISVQGMHSGEYPTAIYSLSSNTDSKYVLFVTKNGLVKKTSLEEYTTTKRKSGIAAIKLREDDNLANVCLINDEPVVIITHDGMGIKFDSSEIATTSRATSGIKGIALKDGDYVIEGLPIRDTNDDLAIFTAEGKGKRIKLSELPTQRRAGKGVVVGKNVVGVAMVNDIDTLLLLGSSKSTRVSAKDLPSLGRQAIGNIMIKDTLQSVSKV